MASSIEQLISALAMALRDYDAGLGPMPREELADALRLAEAAKAEAKEDIEEVYRRGESQGRADHAALTGAEMVHLRLRLADAERVRRGARCLRERCRRLASRARGAEERADIAATAALYAWRMIYAVEHPPFGRGAMLDALHRRVASDYGTEFAERGRASRAAIDALGAIEEVINDQRG